MRSKIILIIIMISLVAGKVVSQSGWVLQNSGTSCDFADAYFLNSQTGYVVGLDTPTVIKTTNGGLNWFAQFTGNIGSNVSIQFLDSNLGFIVSSFSSYRTTNGGSNWLNMTLLNGGNDVMFVNTQTGYIASSGSQVKKTTNSGINWININVPTTQSFYKVFAINEEEVYFGSWSYLFKTTNGGVNYQQLSNYSQDISIYFLNSNTGFIAGELYIGKTTNGGMNFKTKLNVNRMFFRNIQMVDQNTGYAVGNNQFDNQLGVVYKTINGGESWSAIHTEGTFLTGFHFLNGSTGYMVGFDGKILKTTTGGELITHSVSGVVRFEDNNLPVTSGKVKAVKYDYQTHQIIKLDSAIIQGNGSYILNNVPEDSTDIMAFQDDEDNSAFVPTYYPSTIYWQNSNTLYPKTNLSDINIKVYRNNSPQSIQHIGGRVTGNSVLDVSNIPNVYVYAKSGDLFMGYSVTDYYGLYEINKLNAGNYEIITDRMGFYSSSRPIQITNSNLNNVDFVLSGYVIGIGPTDIIPEKFLLFQNFPNPFNPNTRIQFSIPKSTFTKLTIYDVMGRVLAILVNEELKPGTYEVNWDASNRASGVYCYKLETESYAETKKMVLLK